MYWIFPYFDDIRVLFLYTDTHSMLPMYVALTEYLWTKQIVSISSQKWSSTMKWFYLGWKMIAWTSQVSSYFVYVFVVHMNCKSLSSCLAQLLLYTKSSATILIQYRCREAYFGPKWCNIYIDIVRTLCIISIIISFFCIPHEFLQFMVQNRNHCVLLLGRSDPLFKVQRSVQSHFLLG